MLLWLSTAFTAASAAPVSLAAAPVSPAAAPVSPADARPWILDHFEVEYHEDNTVTRHDENVDPRTRSLKWNGEHDYGGVYPNGTLSVEATLNFDLPDQVLPEQAFMVGVSAKGSVTTLGRQGLSAALMSVLGECVDLATWPRAQCLGVGKSQYIDDIANKTVDLSASPAPMTVTLPAAVDQAGLSWFIKFRGGIGTTTPGDPYWRIFVYAWYTQPTAPTHAYDLGFDTDVDRLPPTGASPSVANLTATVRDVNGGPVAGDAVQFRLNPPDMGRLAAAGGVTDGKGEVKVRYTAPTVAELKGREQVTITASDPARKLERPLSLSIRRYSLRFTANPTELQIADPPPAASVKVLVQDFNGAGVTGDVIKFALDPPDMGTFYGQTVNGDRATTQGGVVDLFYEAPKADQLRGRDQVTLYATNLTHEGQEGILFRFKGLHIQGTSPAPDARDAILEPDDAIDVIFDKPIDPASITADNVRVETARHGSLPTLPETFASTLHLRMPPQPIPDMGLVVTVHLKDGAKGVRAKDGSLLLGPYAFTFRTMPALHPDMVISQVVDNPQDNLFPIRALVAKPFAVRVAAGLVADSELEDEQVAVKLVGPYEARVQAKDHTYYPGDRPPLVPEPAYRTGNRANFIIKKPFPVGQYTFRAELRPLFAPEDKTIKITANDINMNRYESPKSKFLTIMAIPVTNQLIPNAAWDADRYRLADWFSQVGALAGDLLPTERLTLNPGPFNDTSCQSFGGSGVQCDDKQPWTHFQYWVRHVGRAGWMTRRTSYIMAFVPRGFFDTLLDIPDVDEHPEIYHGMQLSKVWSYRIFNRGGPPSPGADVSLVEVGAPPASIIHAMGDAEGLAHSNAGSDPLAGYDVTGDRLIRSDDDGWLGAYLSAMNEQVAMGPAWMAKADYEHFLSLWSNRCFGPPCPQEPAAPLGGGRAGNGEEPVSSQAGRPVGKALSSLSQVGRSLDQRLQLTNLATSRRPTAPVPLWGISGVIRTDASGQQEQAAFDPLVTLDGEPTLDASGAGEYAIELRDAASAVLARYPFSPQFGPITGGRLAGFQFTVPSDPAAVTVALAHGAATVTRLTKSAHAPEVAFTQPVDGRSYGSRQSVAWNGQDADGDALTYQLLFSSDAGETWAPLLLDSAATRYTLDTDQVPNGPDSRLRLVASDGFNSTETTVIFSLVNPQAVQSRRPAPGAREVTVRTEVAVTLRDPLDPASVTADSFGLRDAQGRDVAGEVSYLPVARTVTFTPSEDLAEGQTYEARLSRSARTPDGRTLATDDVWRFTTRARHAFLPLVARNHDIRIPVPRLPTALPTPTRLAPPRPSATRTFTPGGPTISPTDDLRATAIAATFTALAPQPSATPTVDLVGTAVAATLTARAPVSTATPAPTLTPVESPTPDVIGTAVAATLTAVAPTRASPGGTATTPPPGSELTMDARDTTGTDATRTRMAFVAGDPIKLWVHVINASAGTLRATFDFTVVGQDGFAPSDLNWQGVLDVPSGASWFRLERTVAAGTPRGRYTFHGSVTYAGRKLTLDSVLYVVSSLTFGDDFSQVTSGWGVADQAESAAEYRDMEYRLWIKQAHNARWAGSPVPAATGATGFVLEADQRLLGTTDGGAGLVYALDQNGNNYFLFLVRPNGQFSLFQFLNGAWQVRMAAAESAALRTGEQINHIMVVDEGGLVTLFANGEQIGLITDQGSLVGRVGVYVEGVAGAADGRFDNFRVYGR